LCKAEFILGTFNVIAKFFDILPRGILVPTLAKGPGL
jgi:hypothetical protein